MTATTRRLIPALLALTLLLGACSLGRTRSAAMPPREQPNPSAIATDVQALRQENARLQKQQEALEAHLEELKQMLAKEREDERSFRESMRTNFDLLEQSVALTLSKTVTADMSRQPAADRADAAPDAQMTGEAPQPQPRAAPQPRPQAAAQSGGASGADSAAMTPQHPAMTKRESRVAPAAVAMRGDAAGEAAEHVQPVADPDLLPPESPTRLSAHPEAKSLYEKGFALFARKDYDQAVIVFRNFLKRFPDDIYSDNAQFWIGKSYLNLNRSNEAEDAYRAVLRNYEHRSTLEGYKTPDAIYRLAQLAHDRGNLRRSRRYYEVLSERFPDTSAGRKADRELDSVGFNTAKR